MPKKRKKPKKKTASKKKVIPRTKPVSRRKKPALRSGIIWRKISPLSQRSSVKSDSIITAVHPVQRGLGEGAAGQSGDLQGLSRTEDANTESVEELGEEGQAFEAEVISGVEEASDPDEDEIHTLERPPENI